MSELTGIWSLLAQALLAAVGVRELARHVFPAVPRLHHPQLVVDVWAPLAIAAPMILLAGRVDGSVRGIGWTPLGGPIACGWVALAAVLIVHQTVDASGGPRRRDLAVLGLTGLLLLLLGAAHVMTIWVGQCAFALAAVLLWINTPDHDTGQPLPELGASPRAGLGMLVALAAGFGQGILAWRIDPELVAVSAGLAVGYAVMALCVACIAGAAAGVADRLVDGGAFGVLLGLGMLSFTVVVPAALRALSSSRPSVVRAVADGFGAYAPEAVAVIALSALLPLAGRLPRGLRRPAGVAIILVVAATAALRIGGI